MLSGPKKTSPCLIRLQSLVSNGKDGFPEAADPGAHRFLQVTNVSSTSLRDRTHHFFFGFANVTPRQPCVDGRDFRTAAYFPVSSGDQQGTFHGFRAAKHLKGLISGFLLTFFPAPTLTKVWLINSIPPKNDTFTPFFQRLCKQKAGYHKQKCSF